MKASIAFKRVRSEALVSLPFAAALTTGNAIAQAQNGTTLAAYKTIDVCTVNATTWRYSGEIEVWNQGSIDTVGLTVTDYIQTRVGNNWVNTISVPLPNLPATIPAGTTQDTATRIPYTVDGPALPAGVRNDALLQILNHSGSVGVPKGPEVRATYVGVPQPCVSPTGCVYTQGYWGNKPDVVWPYGSRTDTFFYSGYTWQQVMDMAVNTAPGYYQLAHQYIAAIENQANGAPVPQGVKDTLALATAWFNVSTNTPAVCSTASSCGTQRDWAKTLDSYNNGLYPGGPQHCGDETPQ